MKKKKVLIILVVLALVIGAGSVTVMAASANGFDPLADLAALFGKAKPGVVTDLPDGGRVYYQEESFANGLTAGSGVYAAPGADISDEALADDAEGRTLGELQGSYSVAVSDDGGITCGTFAVD